PLLWFFRRWPTPEDFKNTMIVPRRLLRFVPEAWQSRVSSYDIVNLAKPGFEPAVESSQIFFYGMAMPGYCTFEHLETRLKQIKVGMVESGASPQGGSAANSSPRLTAMLPLRFSFKHDPSLEFHFRFMQEICRVLGTDTLSVDLNFVESQLRYQGYQVLDLSDGFLISDNYLTHLTLSRGARLMGASTLTKEMELDPGEGARVVRLSPYHGYLIHDKIDWSAKDVSRLKLVDSQAPELPVYNPELLDVATSVSIAMQSKAQNLFPWPVWFHEIERLNQ
ncbi:MAG: hypothetical protein K2X47_12085, partial [Bdellovibrionales bacterium]|nr:hypothetical protein [Bdellovibrionales bacterium]